MNQDMDDTAKAAGEDVEAYRAARARLDAAAEAYYNSETVLMDDAEYDQLARALVAAEDANPDWVEGRRADAVGAESSGDVPHVPAMLSLDNVFDRDALERHLDQADCTWVVEAKLDGLAASAVYRAGRLHSLATRGDGRTGEDLAGHTADITGLPETLTEPVDLTVRGELYMSDDQFETSNSIRLAAGDSPLVNPRNGAAGAVRARHGRYRLPVSFAAYSWPDLEHLDHQDAVRTLEKLGLACASSLTKAAPVARDQVGDQVEALLAGRASAGFPIDGAVIKAADVAVRRTLGETSRAPRWAVAYKFPADSVRTRLVAFEVTVGRTGVITPVAELEPVQVGGATVRYATCSNPEEVIRRDLRVGDMVWVRRAGDVIPEIVSVDLTGRPDDAVRWEAPTSCPRCEGDLDRTGRRWRCTRRGCGTREAVEHFTGRDGMDIEGIGGTIAAQLVESGLVETPADLYRLTVDDLVDLERIGRTRAETLIAGVEKSKGRPLRNVICALGIRGTGRTISDRLATAFGDLTGLATASSEQLAAVEGVGPVRAAVIREELDSLADEIARLQQYGIDPKVGSGPVQGPLAGMTVVVTGRVPGMTRSQAEQTVRTLGGTPSSTVSSDVDLVVVGEGAGSKAAQAARLGKRTMNADDFAALAG